MGQIDLYKGLLYTLPKQPPKEEIQGFNLPKKEQKWKRTEMPIHFDSLYEELDMLNEQIASIDKSISKIEDKIQIEKNRKDFSKDKVAKFQEQINDAISFINTKIIRCDEIEDEIEKFAFEEDRKCTEGVWFYNFGVPTYINGDNYHYLNWFKLNVGYPQYRDRDRRWFYHWEVCDKDPDCLGQIYGKQRRDGFSYRVVSIIYNRARRTFNANYGMMSMSKKDSEEMFRKGIDGFLSYPRFFKPQVQSQEDTQQKIVFKTPPQKVTYKTRVTKKEVSLNTLIDCHPTKDNAMDGSARKIIGCDEAGKFPKDVKLTKWFAIGKICCLLGIKNIYGKILMGSTVNDFENGGADFKEIWDDSLHSEKTANGRTNSWLYRYFIDCADGMEGFIDEYGLSVMETPKAPVMGIDGLMITVGSVDYITQELEAKKKSKDMVGYYELKRQFPRTEEDMFANPADDETCWDIEKIYQQLEHNAIVSIDRSIVCGFFEWHKGDRATGIVEWNAVEKGHPLAKHSFTWLPKQEDRNKHIMKNGKKAPANTHVGLFTLDPYAAVNTVDKRQSKAASHGFKKFDMLAPKHESDVFIGEYWNRLKDPLLVYEDMIMQCVFFGWALLPERNIKNCNDYFRARDYHNYLMQHPEMTIDDLRDKIGKEEDAGYANTGGKSQRQMVEYLASYITNNVGMNEKTGEMGHMPFDNTLKDWLVFNIKKWTPYDLTVSSMLAAVGSRGITTLPKKEIKKINLFPQYKMVNGISQRIDNK